MQENKELKLANEFVQFTNRNIFLTGKAGTGKTTFLHNLRKNCPKRIVVVAPTGVAAINAGGVTIHSFFQLPFGPYLPQNESEKRKNPHQYRIGKEKINLIKSIDLLVIDEISMVRADTLDHIDEVLKRYRDKTKPFGGVQLLMIGDLHQLSPVVKEDEWRLLKDHYSNPYFFNSKSLQESYPLCIELKHIYRQSDDVFISLLNSVRENKIDNIILEKLNTRYIPAFNPPEEEGYITLTSHNYSAKQINDEKLASIKSKLYQFHAVVNGDFPEFLYPNPEVLDLKEGAQVMFVKNDSSRDKLYYNGKIGRITAIEEDVVYVKCPQDADEIYVRKAEWTNVKYELNPTTKEIEEKQIGSFVQFPLRTAWAITIHKSQGLTFEKAIIDANAAFAHGQVYVALSRCKSFEGLVLRSPISYNSIKTDGAVAHYTKEAENNAPDEEHLKNAKAYFQQGLLFELFDFKEIKISLFNCKKIAEDHYQVISLGFLDNLNLIRDTAEKEIYGIADSYKKHLSLQLQSEILPEQNPELQERVKKACQYFLEKIDEIIIAGLDKVSFDADNKSVKQNMQEAITKLRKEIFIKQAVLKNSLTGFDTLRYIRTRSNAEIDFVSTEKATSIVKKETKVAAGIQHPELYKTLKSWRDALAEDNQVPVYMILPQKALSEIVNKLPANFAELESVKGIGKTKIKQFGAEILTIVNEYCEKRNISQTPLQMLVRVTKPEKTDTKKITFDAFNDGKSVSEIAAERGLTVGTVEAHLAHFVGTGELDVYKLVDEIKVRKIQAYVEEFKPTSVSQTKEALGDDISYSDVKAVMKYLTFTEYLS